MDQAARLQAEGFLENEVFTDLELQGIDLVDKELQRCTFRRCKLPVTRWNGSTLEDCRFEACDLSRMLPKGLALRGVRFHDTRLMGIDWSDVRPHPDVRFEACDLRYASFVRVPLRKVELIRCVARETNFLEVDLSDANFAETDLTGATIRGCNLTKADLSRAVGVHIDPQKNKVKGLRLSVEAALVIAQSFGIVVA